MIHVEYEFDYDSEIIEEMSESDFYSFMQNDYQAFQVYMCTKFKLPPVFSYSDIVEIIEDEDIDSVIDYISDKTGWLISGVSLKEMKG